MNPFLLSVVVAGGLMLTCWVVSLPLRDASIVDPLWPLVFVAIAWAHWLNTSEGGWGDGGTGGTKLALAVMVSAWGLRLATHLIWRRRGEGEDYRYRAMRRRWQPFAAWSLVIVFGLQALLAVVVALPLQVTLGASEARSMSWLAWVGVAMFAVGFVIEAGADWQLTRFRSRETSRGAVLDAGFWRYSRHPNYFGDCVVWWGIWLVAAAGGSAWAGAATLIGPIVMTYLLLRFSGVALLERTITKRRPAYQDYIERTSAFIPLPPRKPRASTGSLAS